MNSYQLSPYVHVVENRIFPNYIHYGVSHQLTGEVLEPSARVRSILFAARLGSQVSFTEEQLNSLGADGDQIRELIKREFLIAPGENPLTRFADHYVVRPIQNSAIAYRSPAGETLVVRTSMAQRVFSPGPGELPQVIEETLEPQVAAIFLAADGTKTLAEISLAAAGEGRPLAAGEIKAAIEFLTRPHRQLIKFTDNLDDISDPYGPCNIVPRNMYPSAKPADYPGGVVDFHLLGIDNASWEFDFVEPTINHAFRFPSEALDGLDYGARFCVAALRPDILPLLGTRDRLEVLEVGGGTGTFARSFIGQGNRTSGLSVSYQIVDLSPVLMQSQSEKLAGVDQFIQHYQQDATELDLPGRKFDLIIANEVIADFPVASVTRAQGDSRECEWEGPGVSYLEKYDLGDAAAPGSFLLNTGAFKFLERAWEHLAPGGTFIVTEYGSESAYAVQAYHLNHEEFSIHFGHLRKCAERIGFKSRVLTLRDFLEIDDHTLMLDGQEEQIMCLNHVFRKYDKSLPFALVSEREFRADYQQLCESLGLTGVTFSPLHNGFHFGPKLSEFMVLVMSKPE